MVSSGRPDVSGGVTVSGKTDVDAALLGRATYRSLGEQRLSTSEERFERKRRTAGFVLAPALTLGFLLFPLGLPADQQALSAVLLGVIALWISEAVPIPIGGLIGVALVVFLGVAPADDVLEPFGSPTIFTFIGAFILAQAMLKHGLARRFAFKVLSLPGISGSTVRVIVAFGAMTAMLSAFVSSTATVAMLLPTAMGILAVIAKLLQDRGVVAADFDPLRLRVGAALMLMLSYGACVGGLLTPIGTPPNLIGKGLVEEVTGERIPFGQWVALAFPVVVAMFGALVVVLFLLNRPEIRRIDGVEEYVRQARAELGSLSRAEKNTLIAFGVTVTLWILPGIATLIGGSDSPLAEVLTDRLDEGVVAVVGATLLYLLPVRWAEREFTLAWSDAAKIDWGTILLFGTGIIFGSLLDDTGLAETLGRSATEALGLSSSFAITAFAIVLAIVISETTSNTASAAVVVPIVIPIAVAAGVNPVVPALAATFAASFGFMLPVSTPPNAIVYGSGAVSITTMVRTGIAFDVIGGLVVLLTLPTMAMLLGL